MFLGTLDNFSLHMMKTLGFKHMLPCAFVVGLEGLAVNIHQRSNMFKKAKWKTINKYE